MTPRGWTVAALVTAAMLAWISPPVAAQETATMFFARPVGAAVDGQIVAGEYPGSFLDPTTGMEVFLVHDGENMTIGLVSPGLGWVAIGFGPPGVLMDGANILIGYVTPASTVLSDDFGVGFQHTADTALGGQDDILAKAGSEAGGRTTLELRFPLDTGDAYDFRLLQGQTYGLTLAYSSTADDLVDQHTSASSVPVAVTRDASQQPTRNATLRLGSSGEEVEGRNTSLVATLLGDDGGPLTGSPLSFYLNSSVGTGLLGTVETNANGVAAVNYTLRSPGEFSFFVRFTGDADYRPAQANLTLIAQPAPTDAAFFTTGLAIRIVIVAVLAGVALAYAYSLFQVIQIRNKGSPTGRTPDPAERRKDGSP